MPIPNIALATFDCLMHALKFVCNQRKHPTMMSNKLWAAENRSKNERDRCRILSKAKKFMIELGGHFSCAFLTAECSVARTVVLVSLQALGTMLAIYIPAAPGCAEERAKSKPVS